MSTYGAAQRRWYERNRETKVEKATEYRQKNRGYYRGQASIRYAQKCGFEIVEFVDADKVFERDKGICQLCLEPVDLSLSGKSWNGPQLHHTKPIHSYATVQLAHMKCNRKDKDERQTGCAST